MTGDQFTGGYVGTHTYQEGKVPKSVSGCGAWPHLGRHDHDLLRRFDQRSAAARALYASGRHNGDARLIAMAKHRGWQTLQLFTATDKASAA